MRFKLNDPVLWHGKYQSYEGTIVGVRREQWGEAIYVVERSDRAIVEIHEDRLSRIG